MLFATKDDPASQKALNFQLIFAVGGFGLLVLIFLGGQLNLLLGIEKESAAVVTRHDIRVGGRSNSHIIGFKTESGDEYERTLNTYSLKALQPLNPEQELRIRTDGLFWRKVVAIDNGKGFKTLP